MTFLTKSRKSFPLTKTTSMCQSSPHNWRYLEPASLKRERQKVTIHDVIKCLQSFSASQCLLLKQVCRVGRLLLVMPATNATSERSFSVLRRLKSYLRSTMSQPRLNHMMILSIYKELVDELDLYAVANEFVGSSEHRLRLFGTFTA